MAENGSSVMDSGRGSSRKKRAWRKPREPPTPALGAEEKASKSLKLVRDGSWSSATGEAPSSATPVTVSSSSAGRATVGAVVSCSKDEDTVEKMGAAGAEGEMSGKFAQDLNPPASPVTIDGSIMEGVSLVCL